MNTKEITIPVQGAGSFGAYVAMPKTEIAPVVIIIQEIFGINYFMRNVADQYANLGYIAVVPDLFWRIEPNLQLDDRVPSDWDKALALYKQFDENKGIEDLKASVAQARKMPSCNGKVGTVGFCLGGKLAYLMATRSDADCNVGYYGVGIDNNLQEANKINHPLMLHIAGKDAWCPPEVVAKIKSALSPNPLVTLHLYETGDHAFAREGGEHYVKELADLANRRTYEFFKQHLVK